MNEKIVVSRDANPWASLFGEWGVILPSDGASLLGPDGAVQDQVLDDIARQVASYAGVTAPSASAASAQQVTQSGNASGTTRRRRPAVKGAPDPLETQPLRVSQLSPSVRGILYRALMLAKSRGRDASLNTSFLLLAIDLAGSDATSDTAAKFVCDKLADKRHAIYSEILADGSPESAVQVVGPVKAIKDSDLRYLSEHASAVLIRAKEIAERTPTDTSVHSRQLIAAFLTYTPPQGRISGHTVLENNKVDLQTLRQEYFTWVTNKYHNPQIWATILGVTPRPTPTDGSDATGTGTSPDSADGADAYTLAGIAATTIATDSVGRTQLAELTDLLDVEHDAIALAMLIASSKVEPPLSIGLFGDWGSGKSFFMQLLKKWVGQKASEARASRKLQKDLTFYKNVVQIEFNAWQYMEGNLWASLVDHIFNGLVNPGKEKMDVVHLAQEKLLEGLGVAQKDKQAADANLQNATEELDAAKTSLDNAQKELRNKAEELQKASAKNTLDTVLAVPEVQSAIREWLSALGYQKAIAGVDDLKSALTEAKTVTGRAQYMVNSLLRTPEGKARLRWIVVILAATLLAGLAVGLLASLTGSEWFTQLSTWFASMTTLIAGGARWVRDQAGWLSNRIAEVEKAERVLDARMAKHLEERQQAVAVSETAVKVAEANVSEAQQQQLSAEQNVVKAQAAVDEATPGRLLTNFIAGRVESADYRKHLGILALVRQDFQSLSEFIAKYNEGLATLTDLTQETEGNAPSINRIVLYIDDLDRCPPRKVVEVLQAVHLLLALPLFVVVVAVDARWVHRSLETRYRELLRGSYPEQTASQRGRVAEEAEGAEDRVGEGARGNGRKAVPANARDSLSGGATSLDYLEKIFQIPFWLSPVPVTARKNMVKALLEGSLVKRTQPTNGGAVGAKGAGIGVAPASNGETPGGTGSAADQVEPIAQGGGNGQVTTGASGAGQAGAGGSTTSSPITAGGVGGDGGTIEKERPPDLNPAALTIEEKELAFMEELTPLLGRSPRALKRFINVYRLVKAGLRDDEKRIFLARGGESGQYKTVMFLLALITNHPTFAQMFFRAVEAEIPPEAKRPSTEMGAVNESESKQIWETLRERMEDEDPEIVNDENWQRATEWLEKYEAQLLVNWRWLDRWVQRVARYSFSTEPGWLS